MPSALLSDLEEQLGSELILTDAQVKERYHHIWKMDEPLEALAVILPRTTEEVAMAMKICHEHGQPVVIHGGLTNLVGSTETNANEVVIAMERLTAIEEVDVQGRTMTVQAGVILENIQNAAKENDLLFPLNFGAKGSAQIGGIISTNAGGLRVFRYGMTRSLVLGLEAVLPDGTIISSLKKIIKDNSAYDVKQLFIGSEGTLGVITKAILKLVERPKSRTTAFVGINEYKNVVTFLKYMDANMAGTLSGYELIWKSTYQVMTSSPADTKPPLPYDYNFYVLLEGLGAHPENDQIRLQELLEQGLESALIVDAVIADGESDMSWFWKIREDVHVVKSRCNHDQHFDISLPISLIGDFVEKVTAKLFNIAGVEEVFPFGHVADGNIHFIIGKKEQTSELVNAINDAIYTPLQALGGSVSAEHGIGLHKKAYLHLCRTTDEIQLMKTLKKALDPQAILNRNKVFD